MRSIELARIDLKSALKTIVFACAIPLLVFLVLMGIQIVVVNSLFLPTNQSVGTASAEVVAGTSQFGTGLSQLLVFLIPYALSPVVIGAGILVLVFSYNLFASRFGGLIIKVSEHEIKP